MSRMHFDHLETGGQRALRRVDKGLDDVSDLAFVQLLGLCVLRIKGDWRRANRQPAALVNLYAAMLAEPGSIGTGLTPCVGQLDASNGALSGNETGDALQGFDLFIVPQAKVLGGDSPVGRDCRGFRKDQSGAADGATTEVDQVPVIGQAIDARILAHWRYRNAVEQGQLTKSVGFKQQTHGAPLKSVGRLQGSV